MPSPHVHYPEAGCPHPGCPQRLEWIDFRLEVHDDDVEKPLMRAWHQGAGFVGRCPTCGRWIHFTTARMQTATDEQAAQLPQLPGDWFQNAEFA